MTVNIAMEAVNSSQIHSIGHDAATNTLAIRFKQRGEPAALYHYQNVTADDFAAFKGAESIGSHFGRCFKADTERFPFQRINEEKTEE
ncbi:hypothetical protein Z042_23005 [Chania multitudinisentens RB-25]|uniref:KTSC domain-containing protein n=1 Tax=Chania multitudinisentens RB-25 TaxID=1441930 RepID=W0LII9_9GAMM|nr:KTSC domain-containing protein [Chania multitudinisentens]AHG22167.1 hypothetical protein Z042_23005 [Chania multitudinisentens RB-25]